MNNMDINKTENSGKDFEMSTSSAITKEDWMSKKWRPMMGWVYMSTCTFDFVIAPILWSILQAYSGGAVTSQWMPLTLQGAGLCCLQCWFFHSGWSRWCRWCRWCGQWSAWDRRHIVGSCYFLLRSSESS